jgi:hypothetical protein
MGVGIPEYEAHIMGLTPPHSAICARSGGLAQTFLPLDAIQQG